MMMTTEESVWDKALPSSVTDKVAQDVREILSARSPSEARSIFEHWMDRYAEAEMARPCEDIVNAHEYGGHLRPLFARHRIRPSEEFLAHCRKLFSVRRRWARENLYHGYCNGHEVHHEPETFLYFQIPLLDLMGDPEVLAAVEDVASMAGNWAEGVPDWYDWEAHGFRSVWLGSREVRASHPDDYQEANHWRIISTVLAAHRHGAGDGRYLELATDYAERWLKHIERCLADGKPVSMQILPEGAKIMEMGHAGDDPPKTPAGVYPVFYSLTASNTAFDVGQGLQDVYRLTGEERFLSAAGDIIDQFRGNADPSSGRWPVACSGGAWTTRLEWSGEKPPMAQWVGLLSELVLRQESLRPDPGRRRDFLRWAEAVLSGSEPRDAGSSILLFVAFMLSGDERFRTEGYRRLACGLATVFDNDSYHCCNVITRAGFGSQLVMPWLAEAGLAENGTRGSWPMKWNR